MASDSDNITSLLEQIGDLTSRLQETEDTLSAIRNGEVDAIVVTGKNGDKVFSLASSETPYRTIIEVMDEGAVTVNAKGIILYSNNRFSELIGIAPEKIPGSDFSGFLLQAEKTRFRKLLRQSLENPVKGEVSALRNEDIIHLRLSMAPLPATMEGSVCIVVSDITEISNYQHYLEQMVEERTSRLRIANKTLLSDLEKISNAEKALQQNEKELLKRETLFRSAFDEGAVPMTITEPDGRFKRVNRAFCSLTGYSEAELMNMSSLDLTSPDDLEVSIQGIDDLKTGRKKVIRLEKKYIRKDGRPIWVSISTAPVKDESGAWDFFITHIQDINKRKVAETRLRESKEKFKQLANSIPQLAWIARSDGNIFWFNQRWYEYTGAAQEEMIGWGWINIFDPDLCETNFKQYQSYISKGQPFEMIISLKSRDGSYREFLTKCIPIRDKNGLLEQWFGTHTDISQLKRIESELRNSRKKLNIALENGKIGTWEWNLKTGEVSWDDRMERMFGLEPGTFEGTYSAFENLIHEEDLLHVRNAVNDSIANDKPFEAVYRTRPVEGRSNYITAKGVISRDRKGNPVSMAGVCFDVSGMKKGAEEALFRMNEELLRSNTDLQQFAYVASHDLQEPLRMVSSFTQLLQQRYSDRIDDDGKEYIRFAVEGSKRMYDLLNGLLTYSRIHTKGQEFHQVDTAQVVEKVRENLSLVIYETKTEIKTVNLPVIHADENQMMQLIQNLIENSIKFSNDPPRITISAETDDENHIFCVKDKGIGIEPRYHDRIFRIFQRLHRIDEYEGTGIGLAICKRIVERHGGKIWVKSDIGKGASFYFTIPVSPQNTGSVFKF